MLDGVGVEVLRSGAELRAIAGEWRDLWALSGVAKPFQRPEWLLPWWQSFGQECLYAVCLRRGGRLAGLLPLYVYADAVSGERQLLLVGAGTSDYLDGVFAPDCTAAEVLLALRAVAEEPTWDVAHLGQLLPGSPVFRALDGFERYAGEGCSRCRALSIAGLPKKVRAEVLYFRNAATGRGKLRLAVADAGSCGEAFEVLVRLHTARWEAFGEAGVLADPAVLQWHREAVPLLQAAGCLRFYTLLLDEEPVAALYALVDPEGREGRTAYFYLIGYSPRYGSLKPGTLLTAMAVEHAAAEGVETIDMLRGEEAYKRFWHVEEVPTFGYSVRRESLCAAAG